jgi:hypothetical protein
MGRDRIGGDGTGETTSSCGRRKNTRTIFEFSGIGSERIGSERIGSEWIGSERKGTDRSGKEGIGEERLHTKARGYSATIFNQ